MTSEAKILITGFCPFLGEKINPSEILLDWLKQDFTLQKKVDTLLLPVSFAHAVPTLQQHIAQKKYQIILMLGQAGGRDKVCLERVALNWVETEKPDEDGQTPRQGEILAGGESALFSTLPLTLWKEHLQKKNLPVSISLSAGGYVCNYVYYRILSQLRNTQSSSCQACFIHVPYLPEQVVHKGYMPAMDLEVMKEILKEIINLN